MAEQDASPPPGSPTAPAAADFLAVPKQRVVSVGVGANGDSKPVAQFRTASGSVRDMIARFERNASPIAPPDTGLAGAGNKLPRRVKAWDPVGEKKDHEIATSSNRGGEEASPGTSSEAGGNTRLTTNPTTAPKETEGISHGQEEVLNEASEAENDEEVGTKGSKSNLEGTSTLAPETITAATPVGSTAPDDTADRESPLDLQDEPKAHTELKPSLQLEPETEPEKDLEVQPEEEPENRPEEELEAQPTVAEVESPTLESLAEPVAARLSGQDQHLGQSESEKPRETEEQHSDLSEAEEKAEGGVKITDDNIVTEEESAKDEANIADEKSAEDEGDDATDVLPGGVAVQENQSDPVLEYTQLKGAPGEVVDVESPIERASAIPDEPAEDEDEEDQATTPAKRDPASVETF